MMKVSDGNSRKIKPANSNDRIKFAKKDQAERTKTTLRYVRTVHQIKSDGLGPHYQFLGDMMWQILCDISLRNLDGIDFPVPDLERSLGLSGAQAERYVAALVSEGLLEARAIEGEAVSRNLLLTELGRSKMHLILDQCKTAFTESFIYSTPTLVKTGD